MSKLSDQGTGGVGRSDAEEAANRATSMGSTSALRRAATAGRVVAVVAPLALVVHTAAWMVLGAGPLRTALAWSCTAVLALCLLAVFAVRAAAPESGTAAVYWSAWQSGLRGSTSRWWRLVVGGLVFPAFVVLLFGVGSSALEKPSTAQKISAAGAEIVAPSVEKVQPLGETGPGRYDDYRARYEVRIPSGRVKVEVLSSEYLRTGDTLYVAYAPGDQTLEPIADESRNQVEQHLAGRSMEFRQWLAVLIGWAGGTVALVVWLIRSGAGRLPKGRMKGGRSGMSTAPVQINGYVEYTVPRPNKSPESHRGLQMRCGGQDLAFQVPGCDAKYAATVLAGQSGQLEWTADLPEAPEESLLATTPVDFVAPDGRRLPGSVPTRSLQDLTARGAVHAMSAPPRAAETAANLVDLGATWPLTVPRAALLLLIPVLALPAPLYALPHAGGWGVALLIASAASAVAACVVILYRDHKHKPQTQ
jgi:hypothetical protein